MESKRAYNREYARRKRAANPDLARHKVREWRRNNPDKDKVSQREGNWKRAGIDITWVQYEALLHKQSGRCVICRQPPKGRWHALDVDHDHVTGKVRGLLCNSCNRALGLFKESVLVLEQAIRYLETK